MYSLFFCMACGMLTPVVACSTSSEAPIAAEGTEKAEDNVLSYFSEYLSGKTAEGFESKKPLKNAKIGEYQALVWSAWKKANQQFDEDKLPAIQSLTEKTATRWKLPEKLEPNCTMPFYWGSKGELEGRSPMFLYVHGSGPKASEWSTGLKICQMFDDAPSLYFIPQIPNEGNYYRWWQKAKQFAWNRLLRQSLLLDEVDPNRLYVFGISEGGYGSQRLASFYGDYWAAAGPMAGGEPLKNAPVENCANIGFSLRTGALDYGFYRHILTGYVNDAFNEAEKQHPGLFTHKVELIPGCGHHIDYRPTTPWLKEFVRNPYPKYVAWENFEMDGWYRDGFYNIQVLERSNKTQDTRTYYEMEIKGNDISMRVDEVTYKCIEKDPHWGIELKFERDYKPATEGKFLIYLNEELVNLNEKVRVTVNGKQVFYGKVKPRLEHMVNSCATFFDPMRIFPAAVEVELD